MQIDLGAVGPVKGPLPLPLAPASASSAQRTRRIPRGGKQPFGPFHVRWRHQEVEVETGPECDVAVQIEGKHRALEGHGRNAFCYERLDDLDESDCKQQVAPRDRGGHLLRRGLEVWNQAGPDGAKSPAASRSMPCRVCGRRMRKIPTTAGTSPRG